MQASTEAQTKVFHALAIGPGEQEIKNIPAKSAKNSAKKPAIQEVIFNEMAAYVSFK